MIIYPIILYRYSWNRDVDVITQRIHEFQSIGDGVRCISPHSLTTVIKHIWMCNCILTRLYRHKQFQCARIRQKQNTTREETWASDLGPQKVRLAPNRTNLGIFIRSVSQKYLIWKEKICTICGQSDPLLAQIWWSWEEKFSLQEC